MTSNLCPWQGCRCTHDDGCVKGWLEDTEGRAVPCPVCRWNRRPLGDETHEEWMARLRTQDAKWQAAG